MYHIKYEFIFADPAGTPKSAKKRKSFTSKSFTFQFLLESLEPVHQDQES